MKARRVRGEEVEGGEDSTLMSLMEATCAALLTVHPLPFYLQRLGVCDTA